MTGRVTTGKRDLRSARERERGVSTSLKRRKGVCQRAEGRERDEEDEPGNFTPPVREEISVNEGTGTVGSDVEEFRRGEEAGVEEIFKGSFDVAGVLF